MTETTASYRWRDLSVVARVGNSPLLAFGLTPLIGHWMGGGLWYWLTPFLFFGIIPIIDLVVGEDRINAPVEAEPELENKIIYRAMCWLFLPLQYITMFYLYGVLTQSDLAFYELVGLTLSMVLGIGMGASVSHELGHRPALIDRLTSILMMAPFNMTDFYIYHNFGHHKSVATPEDHAAARYGQSLWQFVFRSIYNKSRSAWQIEAVRLQRNGLPAFHWRNQMIWLASLPLILLITLTALYGWVVVPLFIGQCFIGRMILGIADYLEHYGLARRKLASGEYEAVRTDHSWDDAYLVSSLMFCQIDRHSDHHANEGRPYQILRVIEGAPRLPYGYMVMMFVAMIPPLWRKMMHPLVDAYYDTGKVLPHGFPADLPARFAETAVYRGKPAPATA